MIFVTSDLHGKFDCLEELLENADFFDREDNRLYILGDVIDRNNQGGIDILKWIIDRPNVRLLLGNHEQMLLASRQIFEDSARTHISPSTARILSRWKENGGEPTIHALKRENADTRSKILAYLEKCPLYETIEISGRQYVLVHGGLGGFSHTKKLWEYTSDEVLWERPYLTTMYAPQKFTVIVGHTPTFLYGKQYQNRMLKTQGWWNIDTGAATEAGVPMLLCLDTLCEYYLDPPSR